MNVKGAVVVEREVQTGATRSVAACWNSRQSNQRKTAVKISIASDIKAAKATS